MSYSAANRLTNFNGTDIPYDADGNALKTPLGNEYGNLTYDSLNQLTDVTISGSAISYSYTYDAEGYRIAKNENGITTTFVTDPNAELSRVLMSTTNGETTYYVYGLGLISQEKNNSYKLYHYDYRGSTTALTTLDGNVTDNVYYDPYGNIVKRIGTTDIPFLYVGKYGVESDQNGLYYIRARYYNPQIQRFINVDPIRDGYNWYGYVNNNPVIYIDPEGLDYYIFYSTEEKDFEKQAIDMTKQLTKKMLKDGNYESVHTLPISSNEQFVKYYNQMGIANEDVDYIIIITHGSVHGFSFKNGTRNVDIYKLDNPINVDEIYISACNVGNVDSFLLSRRNVAKYDAGETEYQKSEREAWGNSTIFQFFDNKKINVKKITAWDSGIQYMPLKHIDKIAEDSPKNFYGKVTFTKDTYGSIEITDSKGNRIGVK